MTPADYARGEEVGAVRRVGVVLLFAVAAVTACGVRPEQVPGAAAPITATASASASARPSTGATASPGPGGTALPPVPTEFDPLNTTAFGVSVMLPAPADWTPKPSRTAGRDRMEVDLGDPDVLLRVDVTARGEGSAADGARRNESTAGLPGYRRIGITPVDGVGDDAVDWAFTFERDGTRRVIDRQIVAGDAGVAIYYSAPEQLYQRYLPVWQRAVDQLAITTS
jgi:hypothetical protein